MEGEGEKTKTKQKWLDGMFEKIVEQKFNIGKNK